MKLHKIKSIAAIGLFGTLLGTVGCNSSSEVGSLETFPSVAVTAFSLQADTSVMSALDSVYFSIDMEHGVIYNADSLPINSKITDLIPVIKYSDAATAVTLIMENGQKRTGNTNYMTNPKDTIDFTGNVTLRVQSNNNLLVKDYRIKVNVHKQKPDSLMWTEAVTSTLPARKPSPLNQKSVETANHVISLIEENDGTYTLATTDNIFANEWTRSQISFSFTPDVRSLTACDEGLYMLDNSGHLMTSTDGLSWSDTGMVWNRIIGPYLNTVTGIRTTARGLVYAQYPLQSLNETVVDSAFPIDGYSNFVTLTNKWTLSPVALMVGGRSADNELLAATWAFDGANWIELSRGGLPQLSGASLIPYYIYRRTTSTSMKQTEFEVWMVMGGQLADGSFNRDVYISNDNGVTWRKGNTYLQLPAVIPSMANCDAVVAETEYRSELSDAWKKSAFRAPQMRLPHEISDGTVTWQCPYIYLIGGQNAEGKLYDSIWRGVLTRLTFTPLF